MVAENQAKKALDAAQSATGRDDDMNALKADIALAVEATNAQRKADELKPRYGVKQALDGAINHIGFAGDSEDASENIKVSAEAFTSNATAVLDRCDISPCEKSLVSSAASGFEPIPVIIKRLFTGCPLWSLPIGQPAHPDFVGPEDVRQGGVD